LFRRIAAIIFIFICTSIAWMILGGTLSSRTSNSTNELSGHVLSTWGTAQEQTPPTATYTKTELAKVTYQEHGKTLSRVDKQEHEIPLSLNSTHVNVDLHLDHRQKGLLWYSTYVVDFAGDYSFSNPTEQAAPFRFQMPFPAQAAVYDGLTISVNGQKLPITINDRAACVEITLNPKDSALLHVAYRSQGLNNWRYKLADGVAQVHNFALVMHTNFKDIDFADDTLSPTSKQLGDGGWALTWRYSDLVSGFQIGMTMPDKLQPGPLAGEISFFAPVSLFFFFFLMFIITTMRNIDLHPMNYFFLATAFFAFHLLLAYLVDHISIHASMVMASVVSVALVISYLRLVVGIRFAALEAGTAQLIYLVLFSYAFFWKGFTGLAITIISIITLFAVMQATGRIKWSEKFVSRPINTLPNLG